MITTKPTTPHTGMVVPTGGNLLFSQIDTIQTRFDVGETLTNLFATGDPICAFTTLNQAIGAAKIVSAGEKPGIVILKSGSQFAIHGSTLVSDTDITFTPGGKKPFHSTEPTSAQLNGKFLSTFDQLQNLNSEFVAIVDDQLVLKPVAGKFGGKVLA